MTLILALSWGCRAPVDGQPAEPDDPPLAERCFGELGPGAILGDYEPLGPVVPDHCQGTDHQDIDAVGKVVFLGDSITAGTPPTPWHAVYREVLTRGLQDRFGQIEVADCSEWGARIDDLLRDAPQIEACFPEPEPEPVLVVFTVGGNDMVAWGDDLASGVPRETVEAELVEYLGLLEDALRWFEERDGTFFQAGVSVVFANVYEYTDGTNDVGVCPLADLFDVPEGVQEFREGYVALNEAYVDLAVKTQTDVIFLFEHFCGHGFFHDDPSNPCYRGPGSERWFDDTCIHPNEAGHAKIAEMFLAVIDE